jgi:hypothetical protein
VNIESLVRVASPQNQVGTLMLRKGLDQSQSMAAQLLQTMPPAPQPAHLGSSVDLRV